MPKIVISDTSCLIVLDKINEITLLQKIYSEVITTPEISHEFKKELPAWIKVQSSKDLLVKEELEVKIDKGEASAIALGLEIKNCTLILDDLKARKVAETLRLDFTCTLGVLLKAKELKLIDAIKPLLEKLHTAGMYFSPALELEIINLAGE
jgi:Predicted nucleic acid-binding protein, contains PIN domain